MPELDALALAEQLGLFGARAVPVKAHVRTEPSGKRVVVAAHRRKVDNPAPAVRAGDRVTVPHEHTIFGTLKATGIVERVLGDAAVVRLQQRGIGHRGFAEVTVPVGELRPATSTPATPTVSPPPPAYHEAVDRARLAIQAEVKAHPSPDKRLIEVAREAVRSAAFTPASQMEALEGTLAAMATDLRPKVAGSGVESAQRAAHMDRLAYQLKGHRENAVREGRLMPEAPATPTVDARVAAILAQVQPPGMMATPAEGRGWMREQGPPVRWRWPHGVDGSELTIQPDGDGWRGGLLEADGTTTPWGQVEPSPADVWGRMHSLAAAPEGADPRDQRTRAISAAPWTVDGQTWAAMFGVAMPGLAEISGVQRGRMSKRAVRQFDAERSERWAAFGASSNLWRVKLQQALTGGIINAKTRSLSRDARSELHAVERQIVANEVEELSERLYRESRRIPDSEWVKGAQFYDILSGGRGTVTRVFKKSVYLTRDDGQGEWKRDKHLLSRWNSLDIDRMIEAAGYKLLTGVSEPFYVRSAPLTKGGPMSVTIGDHMLEGSRLTVSGEACEWRQITGTLGVIRVMLKGLDKVLCIVAHDMREARQLAGDAIGRIRAGLSPARGIMRRPGDLPLQVV